MIQKLFDNLYFYKAEITAGIKINRTMKTTENLPGHYK